MSPRFVPGFVLIGGLHILLAAAPKPTASPEWMALEMGEIEAQGSGATRRDSPKGTAQGTCAWTWMGGGGGGF